MRDDPEDISCGYFGAKYRPARAIIKAMLGLRFKKPQPGEAPASPPPKPGPVFRPVHRQPRGDIGGAETVGTTLTRLAVVLLSTVNAIMWEVYTESPVMAGIWLLIAVGFMVWILYDAHNR
jgi:hypothetical protein